MIPLQHGLSSVSFSLTRDVEHGSWFIESLDGTVALGKFRMSFGKGTRVEEVLSQDFMSILYGHLPIKLEPAVKTVPGKLLETPELAIFDLRVMASIVVGAVQRVMVRVRKVTGNFLELLSTPYRVDRLATDPVENTRRVTQEAFGSLRSFVSEDPVSTDDPPLNGPLIN